MMKRNSFYSFLISVISSFIFLSACAAGLPTAPSTVAKIIAQATVTPIAQTVTQIVEQFTGTPNHPAPTSTVGHFPEKHLTLPSGLRIDEYALQAPPAGEPLVFIPVLGSQAAILAEHATERQTWLPDRIYGGPVLLHGEKLIAHLIETNSDIPYHPMSIELILNGKTIYSTPAGISSPSSGMKGLWSYDNGKHWVLEIADLEMTPTTIRTLTGKTIRDGKLINDQIKAQEVFGFQVFKDKPFYFFKRDDHISISYDGQETLLRYTDLPHYNCCSLAALDSQQHPSMVAFFARKQGTWYYVEIGVFD